MFRKFFTRVVLTTLDRVLFALLVVFLLFVVVTSGMANIQTDAIDYYAILQRLAGDEPPILPDLPFVEQRSPGYPLLSLPAYYVIKIAAAGVTPEIVHETPPSGMSPGAHASEQVLIPSQPLLIKDIFFKEYDLSPGAGWFKWNIIASMLLTGFGLFLTGLFLSGKTLGLLYPKPFGMCLAPLMVISSMVFMHNLVQTPAYGTLTVFGISCIFTWFWVKGWHMGSPRSQTAAGLFAGLMVLTRLETVLIVIVLLVVLLIKRAYRCAGYLVLGGLPPLALLLFYNHTQFGNLLHAGILKGDMNRIAFDASYAVNVLVGPRSGLIFFSTLAVLGLAGLFLAKSGAMKTLGWASLLLILLISLRVPVMFSCVGQGLQFMDGVSITCPPDTPSMLELIRFDANRYIIPLVPFAVLGLRELIEKVMAALGGRNRLQTAHDRFFGKKR